MIAPIDLMVSRLNLLSQEVQRGVMIRGQSYIMPYLEWEDRDGRVETSVRPYDSVRVEQYRVLRLQEPLAFGKNDLQERLEKEGWKFLENEGLADEVVLAKERQRNGSTDARTPEEVLRCWMAKEHGSVRLERAFDEYENPLPIKKVCAVFVRNK